MELSKEVGKRGFRSWYERQLIESHAWFVSGFVCMIAIAACLEELTFRGSVWHLLGYSAVVLAAGIVGVYGIVRYQRILVQAERFSGQSTCSRCKAYAAFEVINERSEFTVRCRRCQSEWCMR